MAVFVIVGIRRSGIHAIQSYIEEQLGEVLILNDIYPELNYWYYKKDALRNYKHTIAIFEDRTFVDIVNAKIYEWMKPDYTILILRDALNMMASRYKQLVDMDDKKPKRQRRLKMMFRLRTAAHLYARYAEEFLGKTDHLHAIKVNYNKFVRSAEHRAELGKALGLPDPEHFPCTVQDIASGSSFDYLTKSEGKAHEMEVLDRWCHFESDETFWKYFQPEMLRYSREIFDIFPEKQPNITD